MANKPDTTLIVLKEIRDELRTTRDDLRGEIRTLRTELTERIDQTNERLSNLELGMLDLAQQQRFVVRYLKAMTERQHGFVDELRHVNVELAELKVRVDALEARRDD